MVAIVGAGIAGIAAARGLAAAGHRAVLFDKGRGIGGRVATRRGANAAFDHGAPLLEGMPRDLLAAAGAAAAPWRDVVVGVPGNSALPRALAAGLDVRCGTRVAGLRRTPGGWRLGLADGAEAGPFAVLLLALPQPQALALLGDAAGRFPDLARVTMRPVWTLMTVVGDAGGAADWAEGAGPVRLAVREAAKPGREDRGAWTLHADEAFSEAHLEAPAEAVTALMVEGFRAATGAAAPLEAVAHRWRYARTGRALGADCLWDASAGVGLAGDWCLGDRAGDAAASGRALARRVVETR